MGKFETGQLVATSGVVEMANADLEFSTFIGDSFGRYINCDWGDTCVEDAVTNDEALVHGDRILAVYKFPDDPEVTIWIITEWDRSATTILFPDEY